MNMNQDPGSKPLNGGDPVEGPDIALVNLANAALRHRYLLLGLPLLLAVLFAGWAFSQQRSYQASASFIPHSPEGRTAPVGAAAIARQFGINVGLGERATQSPQFYADVLRSREVLRRTVETEYVPARPAEGGNQAAATLMEIYEVKPEGRIPAWRMAVEKLQERLTVSVRRETGIVDVAVSDTDPVLAEQIVARLLEILNEFNLATRQQQAADEGRFVSERMDRAQQELAGAEEQLKRFLQSNRQFEASPELRFEYDRLQRQLAIRQDIFTSLAQSREQSRIDAARDVPVIALIARPDGSAEPQPRGTVIRGILGFLLGLILATFLVLSLELARRVGQEDRDEYREFTRLKDEAWNDLRRPTRRVRAMVRK
jgi:uncharacterized protein involved in exopolysaccharide biosynthesis